MQTERMDIADALAAFEQINRDILAEQASATDMKEACKKIDALEESRKRLILRMQRRFRIAPLAHWLDESRRVGPKQKGGLFG